MVVWKVPTFKGLGLRLPSLGLAAGASVLGSKERILKTRTGSLCNPGGKRFIGFKSLAGTPAALCRPGAFSALQGFCREDRALERDTSFGVSQNLP